ncbi:MAG: hypothetical protein U1E56_04165 [Bauldia sp.]
MNLVPAAWLAAGGWLVWHVGSSGGPWLWIALGWVYVLPPLVGRTILLAFGRPEGRFNQRQPGYRVWWVLTQLQIPYGRLPILEEALRLIPALYPLWIALWGGSLSPFAYVAPGVVITDRYLVRVGRRAVLGYRATLAGHIVSRGADGRWELLAAPPIVEESALLGGDSGLGPGARVKRGAMLPYGRRLGPYSQWPRSGGE